MNQSDTPPTELSLQNLSRSLDWRWNVSSLPDDQFIASAAANDEWVIRTRTWRQSAPVRATGSKPRSGSDHDSFLATFRLFRNGPSVTRELLEAALLTGEPADRVAAVAGVPVGVAEVYGKVFFDVADRLGDRDWVETAVIGSDRSARHAVWKRFAYHDGLSILKMVVAVSLGRPLPPDAIDRASPSAALVESWLRAVYANIIAIAAASPESTPQLQRQFREWVAANPRPESRSVEDVLWEATVLARSPIPGQTRSARLARAVKAMVRGTEPPVNPRRAAFRARKEKAE